jgi:hypothetical protein
MLSLSPRRSVAFIAWRMNATRDVLVKFDWCGRLRYAPEQKAATLEAYAERIERPDVRRTPRRQIPDLRRLASEAETGCRTGPVARARRARAGGGLGPGDALLRPRPATGPAGRDRTPPRQPGRGADPRTVPAKPSFSGSLKVFVAVESSRSTACTTRCPASSRRTRSAAWSSPSPTSAGPCSSSSTSREAGCS